MLKVVVFLRLLLFPHPGNVEKFVRIVKNVLTPINLSTRAKIDQVDATLFAEQRLNNVVIKVQQHLLNSQC